MNDLVHELRDLLDERSRDARVGSTPAPKVFQRARRRQLWTALGTVVTVAAVVAGSIAGISAVVRTRGPVVVTDPGVGELRTASINGATITFPTRWHLLALPTAFDGMGDIVQLTNFDPASTQPCFTGDAVDLPPDGVLLLVERGTGPIGDDAARWPVPLAYDPAPSACRPGSPMESPEPGLPWRESAEWASENGSIPYSAYLVYGPDADPRAREALVAAFGSLTVDDPVERSWASFVTPAYVLASGDGWNLLGVDIELPDGRHRIEIALDSIRQDVGGSISDVQADDLAGSIDATLARDGSIAWGAVTQNVARVEARGANGVVTQGEIAPMPPSFDVAYSAFAVEVPDPSRTRVTAFDAAGGPLEDTTLEVGPTPTSECAAPVEEPSAPTLPLPTTENAQSWLRNALVAARTLYADCESYTAVSPETLAAIEPSLNYDTSDTTSAGIISIRDVAAEHVLFVTADNRGDPWCIADDVANGTTTYGKVDATTLDACVGGWDG